MFKKITFLFILFLFVLAGYVLSRVPVLNINRLASGYVKTTVKNEDVSYLVTSKRPRNWAYINTMPKHVYYAFIVSEDWSFYEHQGVDFRQIYHAVTDHLKGEKLRGASTISQQLAKNLYTKSERSLERKVFELFTTMYLEEKLSKNRILETYLNVIEFGKGLYGIKDASWYYFKKRPADLNPKESAFLAMLLPNPKIYSQSFRDKKLTEYATTTVNSILRKMKVTKAISEEEMLAYQKEALSFEQVTVKESGSKQILEEEFFEL
ncbi:MULTISPECIES: biosynthetic peptidoglycan transglycosylase [Pseudomonadati]|uniref:biosynthetic peptidoglycan transglycosylase n=1 Tax=unclassified Halobacteriovorax TaxID=2639665 RepID=UPI000CD31D1C|nr:biosynthetic peptidoglycan transglycosylase [Halobacteriovorax sp. DA5]POB12783.1 hypothetical protein C0Z22_12945 [Halobacteriovorax sp. DA5]